MIDNYNSLYSLLLVCFLDLGVLVLKIEKKDFRLLFLLFLEPYCPICYQVLIMGSDISVWERVDALALCPDRTLESLRGVEGKKY